VKINVALVLFLSVIPDIDIFLEHLTFIAHRGPLHSVVLAFIVFVPLFVIYRQKAIPYFVALISHPLMGDFFTGGRLQLLWPLSSRYFGITTISIQDPVSVTAELILFFVAIIIMVRTGDLVVLLRPHKSDFLLLVPLLALLAPILAGYPLRVPLLLIVPHVFFIVLFLVSIAFGFIVFGKRSH
jgi:hypothetical protein